VRGARIGGGAPCVAHEGGADGPLTALPAREGPPPPRGRATLARRRRRAKAAAAERPRDGRCGRAAITMGRWGMDGVAVRDFVGRGGGRREGRVGREDPRLPHSLDKPGIIVLLLARVSSGANGRLSSLP